MSKGLIGIDVLSGVVVGGPFFNATSFETDCQGFKSSSTTFKTTRWDTGNDWFDQIDCGTPLGILCCK